MSNIAAAANSFPYSDAYGSQWMAGILAERLSARTATVHGPLFKGQNSRLFHAFHQGLGGAAAVKLCLQPHTMTPDTEGALEEFAALTRIRAALQAMEGLDGSGGQQATCSVPQPYLLGDGWYAMEWIAGKSLGADLYAARSVVAAESLLAGAGSWLRTFHRAGEVETGFLDAETMWRQAAEEVAAAGAAPTRDALFARAMNALEETAAAASAVPLRCSWLHGDFKTDNLIDADGRIVGLDFSARMENVVVFDIASFLNHLELQLADPRAWRLSHARARLEESFIAHYGFDGGRAALALCWLRLFNLLALWRQDMRRHRSLVRALALEWLFRRVCARLLGELEGGGSRQ